MDDVVTVLNILLVILCIIIGIHFLAHLLVVLLRFEQLLTLRLHRRLLDDPEFATRFLFGGNRRKVKRFFGMTYLWLRGVDLGRIKS